MQGAYEGRIDTTTVFGQGVTGHKYWLIDNVRFKYGNNNENHIDVNLVFDSGVGSTFYFSDDLRAFLKGQCRVVDDKEVVNIFGVDLPFYKATDQKFKNANILGMCGLKFTRSSIVKDYGNQGAFTWSPTNTINILPTVIYTQTYDPSVNGQPRFVDITTSINKVPTTRTVIFDTGCGLDYVKIGQMFLTGDKSLSNLPKETWIFFKFPAKSYSFYIHYNTNFLENLVGPKNFIQSQIVFIGRNDGMVEWAIADP